MLRHFPIEDGLVLGHLVPDADSLCSGIVFTRMLRDHGKNAFFYIQDNFLPQYRWLIDDNVEIITFDINSSFCKKVNTFYVLDSEPVKNRIGFAFPKHCKIVNIDHHIHRLKEVYPKRKINYGDNFYGEYSNYGHTITAYLENSISTSSIISKRFDRKDDILALGIYFDSAELSTKILDATQTIADLNIDEERLSYMISKSSYYGNKNQWDALIKSNTWWSDSGEICFCYNACQSLDARQAMYILGRYAKTVVFFHKNKNVSMRSTNPSIDLSEISYRYGGGGHIGAAGFRINKKISLIKLAEIIKADKLTMQEQNNLYRFNKGLSVLFKQKSKREGKK